MDKETLSNYGWVVIAVLVLSVMIALATPFGKYIATAVENTTQGLFDVQQKAMGVAGLVVDDQNFEDNGGGSTPNTPAVPEFELKEGYLSGTWQFNDTINLTYISQDISFSYEHDGTKYNKGRIYVDDLMGVIMFEMSDFSNSGPEDVAYSGTYQDGFVWKDGYRTITFTSEQEASSEFWNWFVANATRIA